MTSLGPSSLDSRSRHSSHPLRVECDVRERRGIHHRNRYTTVFVCVTTCLPSSPALHPPVGAANIDADNNGLDDCANAFGDLSISEDRSYAQYRSGARGKKGGAQAGKLLHDFRSWFASRASLLPSRKPRYALPVDNCWKLPWLIRDPPVAIMARQRLRACLSHRSLLQLSYI